ncbi:phosphoenolpyruvate synthase [Haloactinopolyspora alba]|uniref:Phosphoenolpyruvate synthase n=1 Tax=Haloactinopolyspora alba TaxID=648780 RepID=A0A2P8DWI9_9ACTN|nr:phenylalanine--tRNA ligase beta subunit-related protein [Haloactinopolyspora alba]PSL01581.1 phosphoenolpyruvate synthase [Haloactinopolyspora alba]
MHVQHAPELRRDFPELAAGAVVAGGITPDVTVDERAAAFTAIAESRLAVTPESEFPEIQAWRRTFTAMGLKSTQYRCAAESLLRRFRKEGRLPRIHPLIDVCNAMSLAYAVPVAVFDLARIDGYVDVRRATGDETYETFTGSTEHPDAGEVIFADAAGSAHARRWTNRQSGLSAVREATTDVLIVAEGMHDGAATDVERLVTTVADEVAAVWAQTAATAMLTESAPRFDFQNR